MLIPELAMLHSNNDNPNLPNERIWMQQNDSHLQKMYIDFIMIRYNSIFNIN